MVTSLNGSSVRSLVTHTEPETLSKSNTLVDPSKSSTLTFAPFHAEGGSKFSPSPLAI